MLRISIFRCQLTAANDRRLVPTRKGGRYPGRYSISQRVDGPTQMVIPTSLESTLSERVKHVRSLY
jgi:hypothetical protein